MADGEKIYPPSDTKLAALREAGVYPVSRNLDSAALIIGAAVGIFVSGDRIHALFRTAFRETFTQSSGFVLLNTVLVGLGEVLCFLLVPIVVCRVLVGLLQSRWHISWPPRSRYHRYEPSEGSASRRFISAVCGAILSGVWIVVGIIYFGVLTEGEIQRLVVEMVPRGVPVPGEPAIAQLHLQRVYPFLSLSIATVILFGILSLIACRFQFRVVHGMTRREVEAEAREFDIKPEMRQARSERRNEEDL